MSRINQYAYKGDGSFHRIWIGAETLKENKNYIITKTEKGTKVIESKGYVWRSKEKAINYFSKSRWFNIIVMYKVDKKGKMDITYYCNLATPIFKESNSLKYIDYDLDVKYNVNSKKVKILDRNEYKHNAQKYGYSPEVCDRIERELTILKYWIRHEIGPFSNEFRKQWKDA